MVYEHTPARRSTRSCSYECPCVHPYITRCTCTPIRNILIPLKGVDRRNVCSSLIIVEKVRNLCFWRCCECYSCECCGVFLNLFSRDDYEGVFGLRESEDFLLRAFGEELCGNCPPLIEEGRRAMKFGVLKFHRWYEQTGTLSRKPETGKTSKMMDNVKWIIEECTSS